jgi:hypothetical protein
VPPRRLLASTAAALGLLLAVPAGAAPPPPPPTPSVAVPEVQAFRTVDPDRVAGGILTSSDGHRAADVLNTSLRYGMTTWLNRVAPPLLERVARTPGQQDKSDSVRRLGMEAMALSVGLRTGAYDPVRVGVSRADAKAAVLRIVERVAANHRSNRTGGWGVWGQSALWSSFTARAAWLMWDDLPSSTQALVQNMLVYEADLSMQTSAVYLRDRTGKLVRAGNSAAEEDAWQALPLQLATATMPTHPHWAAWRHQQVVLMLSAWTRPQDVSDPTVVNGAPLTTWVNGSNVETNGAVVNHDRIAPDYSTNLYQNLDAVLVDALAGLATPEAARWNLANIYRGLSDVSFPAHTYAAPGGTVYQAGRVYYPQGCDWGTGQALPYALVDAQSAAFGFGTSRSAAHETAHLREQQRLTARFSDGRTYATNAEYRYYGREEHTAQLAAQLYLTKLVRDRHLATFTTEPFFVPGARDALGLQPKQPVPFTELGVPRG